jgi:hypothetical protein
LAACSTSTATGIRSTTSSAGSFGSLREPVVSIRVTGFSSSRNPRLNRFHS